MELNQTKNKYKRIIIEEEEEKRHPLLKKIQRLPYGFVDDIQKFGATISS